MGEKRGVWLFVVVSALVVATVIFSSQAFAKSVDVISNGQEWFFCNATGSDAIKASAVQLFGQVPAPYVNYARSSYNCLQSCQLPVEFSKVKDPRFCDPDG